MSSPYLSVLVGLSTFLLIGSCSTGVHGNTNKFLTTADNDRILHIPGVDSQPEFAQYSGYLQGSTDNYQLHYWFIEAETKSKSAPLILWLNGGPGCSSMEGLLSENGPYTVRPNVKLDYNPYSWNKFANMLYLEAPAGVGYSFAVDGNVTTDDDLTSLNNYHALLSFLEKFPTYRDREFYITGESYAGIYVPLLALRVLDNQPNGLNLKGIVVGNGLTSTVLNENSLVYFLNYHGLVDESIWKDALENCCESQCATKCMFTKGSSYQCENTVNTILNTMVGLNTYNLYKPCYGGVKSLLERVSSLLGRSSKKRTFRPDFGSVFLGNLVRNVRALESQDQMSQMVIECTDDSVISEYMNNREVKSALHVTLQGQGEWAVCDEKVYEQYIRRYEDMSNAYRRILEYKVPVMLYAGDVDMACNFLGLLWFVDKLGLPMSKPMTHWLYKEADGTQQVGGFYKVHQLNETKLTYVTIRGAGHMVPEDKPIAAYRIITNFLDNQDL